MARQHGWTIDELQDALPTEIRILEVGSHHLFKNQHNPITASFHVSSVRKSSRTTSDSQAQKKHTCLYCKGPHAPGTCEAVKDHQRRLDIIKREKLCFNCLGHHIVSNCGSKNQCHKCSCKHHTSICNEPPTDNSTQAPSTSLTKTTATSNNTNSTGSFTTMANPSSDNMLIRENTCLLKTAVATITSPVRLETEANILFDEGSQRSFLTQELANLLSLKPYKREYISLATFGVSQPHQKSMAVATVYIKSQSEDLIQISLLIVPTIAVPLKISVTSRVRTLPHLQGLQLAHPVNTDGHFNISLLIRSNLYWDIVEDHIIQGNGPTATNSKIGYLLSGPISHTQSLNVVTSSLHVSTQDSEPCDIQQFWDIETTVTTVENNSDKHFLEEYSQHSITCLPDGSYCAKFPWKENHPQLPTNSAICRKRARSLAFRMSQTPDLLQKYNS